MIVTQVDIRQAISKLGLNGASICVHSSLKSFGALEEGPHSVINGLLNENCTVIVPTFYYSAKVKPPKDKMYQQNGCDYSAMPDLSDENVIPFTKSSQFISSDMGAIPKAILKMSDSLRGNHPINSFTAIGSLSREIIKDQAPLDVYAPMRKLYDLPNAHIILMGTDLTKTTPIHFAEQLAGRRLFREWAKISNTESIEAEIGSCSEGFNSLEPFVSDLSKSITVGQSIWRIYPFRYFIDKVTEAIKLDPMITHCHDSNCLRCHDAIKGGPYVPY